MALTLGQGFAPYFLISIAEIAKENTPETKLEQFGFLNLLQNQTSKGAVTLNASKAGHRRSVRVRKMQRLTVDFTDTSASCDQTNVIPYSEDDVDLEGYRQIAIHVADEDVAQYMEAASNIKSIGTPSTTILMALYERILAASNAILQGVNNDVFNLAAARIGVNRRTGTNTAEPINLALNTTNNPLNNGEVQILADYLNNGGIGRPQIIGSGLWQNYSLQQRMKTEANHNSGFDTRVAAASFDFYNDLAAQNILGANEIVVYQPDSLQLIEYMKYKGEWKTGQKPGPSTFFTMMLPVKDSLGNKMVEFDVQLRYNDCQTTFTNDYYGTVLTLEKGWNIIISKDFGLWTIPSGAYRATDQLNGNRGSLRYVISNT